jgi:hypothetical protein
MWSSIAQLPADVAGVQVFSFLALIDMVRLDSSVVNRRLRPNLDNAFTCTTVSTPQHRNHTGDAWQWCIKRSVAISKLEVSDVDDGLSELFSRTVSLLQNNGTITWYCDLNRSILRSTYNALIRSDTTNQIYDFRIFGATDRTDDPLLPTICAEVQRLRYLGVFGRFPAGTMVLATKGVQHIELFMPSITKASTSRALFSHTAPTLKELKLAHAPGLAEQLELIAHNCRNLMLLSMQPCFGRDLRAATTVIEAGLVAVAKGCRKLQDVSMHCPLPIADKVLIAFGEHCASLQSLEFLGSWAILTDAALLALSVGCPAVRTLSGVAWKVTAIITAIKVQLLLERLITFRCECGPADTIPAMGHALALARNTADWSMTAVAPAHTAALNKFAGAGCTYIALSCTKQAAVPLDGIILATAAVSPRLKSLKIEGLGCVSAPTVLMVVKTCAYIRTLHVDLEMAEMDVVELARRCCHLQHVDLSRNAGFTDTVVCALAQQCPHLTCLDLSSNLLVTESSLAELTRCPRKCEYLVVSTSLSEEDCARLKAASSNPRVMIISSDG